MEWIWTLVPKEVFIVQKHVTPKRPMNPCSPSSSNSSVLNLEMSCVLPQTRFSPISRMITSRYAMSLLTPHSSTIQYPKQPPSSLSFPPLCFSLFHKHAPTLSLPHSSLSPFLHPYKCHHDIPQLLVISFTPGVYIFHAFPVLHAHTFASSLASLYSFSFFQKPQDLEKKGEIESIIGRLSSERFFKLVTMGKAITDFNPEEHITSGDTLDDELGVALVFDDEDDKKESSNFTDAIVESDDDEDNEGKQDTGMDVEIGGNASSSSSSSDSAQTSSSSMNIKDIDAYWLKREITKIFDDPMESQEKTDQVLAMLKDVDNDDRKIENDLVLQLGFDHFDLIRTLRENRMRIVYATLLGQAQTEEERSDIEDLMRNDPSLLYLYNELHDINTSKNKGKTMERLAKRDVRSLALQSQQKEVGAASSSSSSSDAYTSSVITTGTVLAGKSTWRGPKNLLDLDNLAFKEGPRIMPEKFTPPKSAYVVEGDGYEEIHIPAVKAKSYDDTTRLVKIKEMPKWAQPPFLVKNMEQLNPIQSKVYDTALFSDENILMCAPTGAGKTNVAMLTMLQTIHQYMDQDGNIDLDGFKIVYIAPMKALVQEVVMNFGERLESYGIQVAELSGDKTMNKEQIESTQVIVTTPEKWDIITRKSGDRTYTQLVRLIIIDEIHLLHDSRGPVLEAIIARTIRQMHTTHKIRLVGLSATLPNYEDVTMFMRVNEDKGMFFFDQHYRPVPLQQTYVGISTNKAIKRMQLMSDICYEKVMSQAGKNQVIVFVHSRKETARTAREIRDKALENGALGAFLQPYEGSRLLLAEEAENCKDDNLKDIMPYGFGIHHAGMTREDRQRVEDLFNDGHLQVLVSTATLAWGVNLPAHMVIIKGTQVYSPEAGGWTELSFMDIMQMLGRAGRPQHDTFGEGVVITTRAELRFYMSLFNEQLPVESQVLSRLPDMLNAEIVLGTVQNAQEACNWLGYTYLFVRMLQSPAKYGIPIEEAEADQFLEQRRMDLIHSAATILDKNNLIKYDRKSGYLQSTDLGKVASHYYITRTSMSTYNERLKPNMSDIDLFHLFALSAEFKYMHVRDEEVIELQKLAEQVPIPVKESVDNPSAKVNILLQAYISRMSLDGFALASDMVYITQSAGRIVRALFEICLRRGWADMTRKTLNLSNMINHRMWAAETPLNQFRDIPKDIIKQIEKKDFPWDRYYDLTPQQIGDLIRFPSMGKDVYKYIHRFPRLFLEANVQPITREVLRVELIITPDFEFDEEIHGGAEGFWILVEDVNSEVILYSEFFMLKQRYAKDEHTLTFTIPIGDPMPPQYFIRAVSDRWLHSEVTLPVSFRHLILPEGFPEHTELLDLQPLPVNALQSSVFESIYKGQFEVFNPIQTQVFSTLFNSDLNALVSAPTGSGKTACAEFAMIKLFLEKEQPRIVYCAPKEEIVKQRYQDWDKRFGEGCGKTVVMLTGNSMVDLKLLGKADIVCTTPTAWDVLSRRWQKRQTVQDVDLFIADELHMVGGQEGPTYEVIVSRMHSMNAQLEDHNVRIVGLAASVANARDLGEWIGASVKKNSLFNFPPHMRPVRLEITIQGFDIPHFNTRMLAMAKPVYNAIVNHSEDKGTVVFVPSRKHTRLTAIDLHTYAFADKQANRFLKCTKEDLAPYLELVNNKALKGTLSFGVGVYHDGLSDQEKSVVETLFNAGAIQVVIVDHHLCWGMAMTPFMTVIMNTEYYDGREHQYVDYPIFDIVQMTGVAGRPLQKDECGKSFIFCPTSKKEFFKRFVCEPLPIESHLDHFLADHFNAEIVNKMIESKHEAVDYLTWTFMYRRLAQNPNYYNLKGVTHRHLSDHLSELVENTLADLELTKCLEVEDQVMLTALNLGVIASYYYIHYTTVELYNQSLKEKTKLKGLLEIVSTSSEFMEMSVRHREEEIIQNLAYRLPLAVQSTDFSSPFVKTNVLLQCHFSQKRLTGDLASDQKMVLEKVVTMLRALVDVIANSGWLGPLLATMELSQMVTQGLWDSDSPLKQLPHFNDADLLARCEKAEIESVFDLMDMEDDERIELLQMDDQQLADVAVVCNQYPSIEMEFEVQDDDDLHEGEKVIMKIALERESEYVGPVYAPRYPKQRQEGWWVVVSDSKTNQVLAVRHVVFGMKKNLALDFTAPAMGHHELSLSLNCDSYLGCDQEYPFEIDVLEGEEESDEESEEESD
eukprot:TRINITY_DN1876_c0_g1_i1.p1 TRINITY_DN1876_c0_g1~~TRINITY_DN1876_c0_g1_i1.p1  ORF type:complete len:2192 (+),score=792.85 TRINITY_DN1876_c0_g1_i1:639-7214(+)